MNKFMAVVTNKWFRMVVSLLGVFYSILLAYFDYIVFFYDIEYTDKKSFAIIGSVFSIVMCLLFLYTRRSVFTCIFSMLNLLLFFPLFLLDWGNWPLLLPAAVVTLFGFFCCHMNETAKTIFGTIFLLMYILGGIAFFLIMNVFRSTTVDTLIEQGVSPSGAFRYYVLDVQNKSTGKKCVYVQPNTLDIEEGSIIKLRTTIKKMVRQSPNPIEFDCEWSGTRMIINGEVYFDETKSLKEEDGQLVYDIADGGWSYTYFSIDYPIFTMIERAEAMIDKFEEKKNGVSSAGSDASDDEDSGDESSSDDTDNGSSENAASDDEEAGSEDDDELIGLLTEEKEE